MANKQTENLINFIRQHNLNVMRSLYTLGEDDNPIDLEDSIRIVSHKMGFGVREDCHPELLASEVKAIDWVLDRGIIKDQWSDAIVMLKELDVFTNKRQIHATPEQMAEALDVSVEDICSRQDTLDGLRMVWVGGVIRTLAIEAYRKAFSRGIIPRINYEQQLP